ncbi:hypothetical protein [Rhodococcus pyridinivorans]|uniref:SRPBCC family protein n=1 Tax=Rhodococcus pyridinivorans AK37 TaxID=1114960 RepID=H0JYV0_9NOCA|nr:hypothetical protein [Rhodococcus pyridinivorans]EHK80378.1 hypothetical protein AK37_24736 [Rhodococcus pyridinivorans AK37]MCD2142292.1 hypothetical protein [Rhodococcus pyridinivorans]
MPDGDSTATDRQLPVIEQRVVRARVVDAPAGDTFAAIRRIDFMRSPVIAAPNLARMAFDAVRAPRHRTVRARRAVRLGDLIGPQGGFEVVAEEPGRELVLGFVGRWWEPGYGRVDWDPGTPLSSISVPECGVGTWSFTVLPYGAQTCVLLTEIRVHGTDEKARRLFRRYWTAAGPFVRAMARPTLSMIAAEARR